MSGIVSLLRSVIDFDGGVSVENLQLNFKNLSDRKVKWVNPADQKIYDFVVDYVRDNVDIPQALTVGDYFNRLKDTETLERLKDIQAADPYIRTNFVNLCKDTVEEQKKIETIAVLKEALEVVSRGLEIDGKVLKGRKAAVQMFLEKSAILVEDEEQDGLCRGELRADGDAVWKEYLEAKTDQGKAIGKLTGLKEIDNVCKGIKPGELWIHAAFTGELKSTFAMNWCYNQVVRFGGNVFFSSLEMKYKHVRKLIYALHSANGKWRAQGYKPLEYAKIRDGLLTPEEEEFFQKVIEDFSKNPKHGRFVVWSPPEDVTVDAIRTQAELQDQRWRDIGGISLLVIDHGGLVEARKGKRNKDFVVELNSVMRDAKKLALQFGAGKGVPVLLLFQINRQGKDDADKSDGVYKIRALSYSNEAEKSADYITTTYLNQTHRDNGTTLFCNLKNRDNEPFKPFLAHVDWKCRRVSNLDVVAPVGQGMAVDDYRNGVETMFNV